MDPTRDMLRIRLRSTDDFNIDQSAPEAIYTVDIGDNMELAFLAGLSKAKSRSDVLRVGFHAAKSKNEERVHKFSPLTMGRESGDSYLLFADPTLTVGKTTILTWYLGTPSVDPDDAMEKVVRRMLLASGAKYLLIEGSSAGGFTALRFAARFHDCIAVPKIPQTDIFRYKSPWPSIALSESLWDRETYESVLEKYPRRFRIADIYGDDTQNRNNLVHYVQNMGDVTHVHEHLNPFLSEIGASENDFITLGDRITISRPFIGKGHVAIPKLHWVAENDFALARLKKMRPNPQPEEMWVKPETSIDKLKFSTKRAANLDKHPLENKSW